MRRGREARSISRPRSSSNASKSGIDAREPHASATYFLAKATADARHACQGRQAIRVHHRSGHAARDAQARERGYRARLRESAGHRRPVFGALVFRTRARGAVAGVDVAGAADARAAMAQACAVGVSDGTANPGVALGVALAQAARSTAAATRSRSSTSPAIASDRPVARAAHRREHGQGRQRPDPGGGRAARRHRARTATTASSSRSQLRGDDSAQRAGVDALEERRPPGRRASPCATRSILARGILPLGVRHRRRRARCSASTRSTNPTSRRARTTPIASLPEHATAARPGAISRRAMRSRARERARQRASQATTSRSWRSSARRQSATQVVQRARAHAARRDAQRRRRSATVRAFSIRPASSTKAARTPACSFSSSAARRQPLAHPGPAVRFRHAHRGAGARRPAVAARRTAAASSRIDLGADIDAGLGGVRADVTRSPRACAATSGQRRDRTCRSV